MADYQDIVTQKSLDSTIIRVYPNANVEIYISGTSTLVTSVSADSNGIWSVATLDTGKYDIKVDGSIVRTIHFVKSDHVHKADQTFTFFVSGSITADQEPAITVPSFGVSESGDIIEIKVNAVHVDATGDLTVHLCKGAKDGASAATMAGNSVWNYRINPGAEKYRFMYSDTAPAIALAADDVLQIGLDHTANTIEGVSVTVVFRPDA